MRGKWYRLNGFGPTYWERSWDLFRDMLDDFLVALPIMIGVGALSAGAIYMVRWLATL